MPNFYICLKMKLKILCWLFWRSFHEPVTRPKQPTLVAFASLRSVNGSYEHFLSFNKMIFKYFQTARAKVHFLKSILVPLHLSNFFCNMLIPWPLKKEGVELYHRSVFFLRKTAKNIYIPPLRCFQSFLIEFISLQTYTGMKERKTQNFYSGRITSNLNHN